MRIRIVQLAVFEIHIIFRAQYKAKSKLFGKQVDIGYVLAGSD